MDFQPKIWCAVESDEVGRPLNNGKVVVRAPYLTLSPLWAMAVDHGIRRNCLERRARGQWSHLQCAWAIGYLVAVNHEMPKGEFQKVSYSHDDGVFRFRFGAPLMEAGDAWFEPGGVGGRMWVLDAHAGEQISLSNTPEAPCC